MLLEKIMAHPWLFTRKAAGRARRRLVSIPQKAMIKRVNGRILFECKPMPFLDDGDLRAILTASYDLILCDLLGQCLSAGDLMIDVGANVGYISAFAASLVGPKGEVHGFEPLPECFERLEVLKELNSDYQFFFNHWALGERVDSLAITYDPRGGSRNATLVPSHTAEKTIIVPVFRLDDYIASAISEPKRIKLIKIDVEGFEFPVIRGMENFFIQTDCRPLIVCEIKPWEIKRCGYTLDDFAQFMSRFGYRTFDSVQMNKSIDLRQLSELEVVVFRT